MSIMNWPVSLPQSSMLDSMNGHSVLMVCAHARSMRSLSVSRNQTYKESTTTSAGFV